MQKQIQMLIEEYSINGVLFIRDMQGAQMKI